MSNYARQSLATTRTVASGPGWSITDRVCREGPRDKAFDEQHASKCVAAVISGTFVYRSARGRTLMAPGSLLLGEQGEGYCCTHEHAAGAVRLTGHSGGFIGLWREVAGRKRFPARYLTDADETLEDFVVRGADR